MEAVEQLLEQWTPASVIHYLIPPGVLDDKQSDEHSDILVIWVLIWYGKTS